MLLKQEKKLKMKISNFMKGSAAALARIKEIRKEVLDNFFMIEKLHQ